MRTRAMVAVLAVGAVVAGSLVLLGAPGGDDGRDPAPGPTDTPDPGEYPPGVGPGGIENLSRLLAAHRAALVDGGYVVRVERTLRSSADGPNFTMRRRIDATPGLETVRVRRVRRSETVDRSVVDLWHAGATTVVLYDGADREATVQSANFVENVPRYTGTVRLATVLRRAEFDLATVTRHAGETRYALRATGYRWDSRSEDPPDTVGFTARAVVTRSGRIRTVQASLLGIRSTGDGRRRTLEVVTYRLLRTGVDDLRTPDWVEESGNRTAGRTGQTGRERAGSTTGRSIAGDATTVEGGSTGP